MSKISQLFILFLLVFVHLSAGANLLTNAAFQADDTGFVMDWTLDQFKHFGAVTHLPGGGVNGVDAVRLDLTRMIRFVQPGLTLVAGEKYRLGGYVRTNGFKAPRKSIIIYNSGWTIEVGTKLIPDSTDGWLLMEAEIVAQESKDNAYYFAIYATQSEGTVDFCAPFLEALTERGQAESKPIPKPEFDNSRLVPTYPLLSQVDITSPTMDFYYAPFLPKGLDAYELRVSTRRGGERAFSAPVAFPWLPGRRFQTVLSGLQLGPAQMRAELVDKATGEVIASDTYPIRVIEPTPPVPAKALNNLVSELLQTTVTEEIYKFANPREGWIYLALDKATTATKAYLTGIEAPVITHRPGEAPETMRFLSAGTHLLRLEAVPPGSQLTIRTVPQLMVYPLLIADKTDISRFQWDVEFFRRHLWHSFNFQNTGQWIPNNPTLEAYDRELKERGIGVIGSQNLRPEFDTAALVNAIRNSRTLPTTLGLTIDELASGSPTERQLKVANAAWELLDFDKLVYTWICGGCELNVPIHHKNLFAACTNVSQGKGKILFETYVKSQPTEEAANQHLTEYIGRIMHYARQCAPDAAARVMFVMTGLVTSGVYNVNVYPQVDIKYYFDMFFYQLATNPAAKGIFGMGCYNISHCDEETVRWISRLVRHYGIEGKTEMLAKKYGLTYLPGHLQNCDFENGLDNWQAKPATENSLRPLTVKGYGADHLQRRGSVRANGDTTAYFERQENVVNTLSQTAVNLIPGKLYSLTYVTADPEDIEKEKNVHQPVMVRASLEPAEVLPALSYDNHYPKGWSGGWAQEKHRREIITTRIVFKANAEKMLVKFSDEEGTPGQKRLLNFVSLKPYLAE